MLLTQNILSLYLTPKILTFPSNWIKQNLQLLSLPIRTEYPPLRTPIEDQSLDRLGANGQSTHDITVPKRAALHISKAGDIPAPEGVDLVPRETYREDQYH